MATEKIILNDAPKRFTLDQDKIMPPEETTRRFKEKLKTIDLDILDETVRIDNGRLGIPVFFSKCGKEALAVIGNKKQMGKGATPQQAEASAVMELAERFSFFSFCKDSRNFITDTHKQLGERALGFDQIAKSVHDDTEDLKISKAIFENIPMNWTTAYNLIHEETVLIPFTWFFTINEFNGPSAGNCQEEALVQGICEIVERHVSSLVSRNRLKVPGVNAASATDPKVVEMLEKYRRAGIHLHLSDFTLEMGIPTVGALAHDPATFPEKSEIVWTAGTTPDPQKAMSRALTEVAQLAGDFNSGANYVASGLPKPTSLEGLDPIIHPEKVVNIQALPDISAANIRIEVQNCLSALSSRGYEVLVVNTTHSKLEIPAFYTIVPGAHFRERAANTSVAMFSAKIIAEHLPPETAIAKLSEMDRMLPGKYFTQFYIGLCLYNMNKPADALACFEAALDLEPNREDRASIYSYMGVCLKDMERYEAALAVLEKGAALDADRTDIHNLMGFCHFKLKQHESSIACFKRAIRLNPNSAIDYANIASNYRDMGMKEKAVRYYTMALEIDPGIGFALENLLKLESGR